MLVLINDYESDRAKRSQHNNRQPFLARLPHAIRQKIFRYALYTRDDMMSAALPHPPAQVWIDQHEGLRGYGRLTYRHPGALSVCKRMREEAAKVYLKETAFYFDERRVAAHWLRSLDPGFRGIMCNFVYCTCSINAHRKPASLRLSDRMMEDRVELWKKTLTWSSKGKLGDVQQALAVCKGDGCDHDAEGCEGLVLGKDVGEAEEGEEA